MMTDLTVPRRQIAVTVSFDVDSVSGFVFTSEFSERTRGAQRVGELLNHLDAFLPIRDTAEDRVYLYNKLAIKSVTVTDPDAGRWEVEELEYSPAQKVEITLTTGEVLRGITYLDPRPEKMRVSDMVNRHEPFVVLVRDEGVTYVSKRYILRVR